MIAKDNPNPPREKATTASHASERAGEGVKAGTATASPSAANAAAGGAQGARAPSANGARPSYVPARRRSRRNRLL